MELVDDPNYRQGDTLPGTTLACRFCGSPELSRVDDIGVYRDTDGQIRFKISQKHSDTPFGTVNCSHCNEQQYADELVPFA